MTSIRLLILVVAVGTWSVASRNAFAQDVVTMPAVLKRVVVTVQAPARVQATSNTVLSASTAGIVSGLRVLPGETVRPGQPIAHLSGPTVSTETARLAADLKSAQIRVSAATQAAAIEQQKFDEQLSTRDAIARVHAELDTARQQLVATQTAARSYASMATISTSEPGVVTAVNAADGQFVSAGQALVSVASSRGLYVVANVYGSDAALVTPGMKGVFLREGTDAPVDIAVQRASWSVAAPGQLEVWLGAAPARNLVAGTVGTVTLTTSDDKRVAVPSAALILDGGKWWVLVHDKSGNQRRSVVPGQSAGGWTSIGQGLSQGERVVTQDAYLLFHQDFATRYQQAD
ncbi:MAG TPA: efflux RND transporter periplasmic adaptor subunit [Paraburkholderia sp.]